MEWRANLGPISPSRLERALDVVGEERLVEERGRDGLIAVQPRDDLEEIVVLSERDSILRDADPRGNLSDAAAAVDRAGHENDVAAVFDPVLPDGQER